ncbi:thiamine biosynthesis protein ThiJ [marine bacterium AO1-C]|nr:thiamine biosynthesis protein ThiJ [marine bacterium AO1-C]
MKTINIVAFDQFTDIDVFLPWDLFNRIRLIRDDWQVKIVGTQEKHVSMNGLEVATQGHIDECNEADIVLFASGKGARSLINDKGYLQHFDLNPQRQIICSMCSGALILASLGLLDGLTATTYPTVVEHLQALGVEVVFEPLVTHGNIATAAGCLAAVDLVGWCFERAIDKATSEAVLAYVAPVEKGVLSQ